ncbi:MAG: ECF transporter S component [Clostridia bacterium]
MRINAAKKTEMIVMVALFSALIAVMTAFIKIPTPLGYIHAGDAFIFAAGMLLGPYAAIPAMIGSGLADFITGYFIYIPVTIVIKGLMGFLSGYVLGRKERPLPLGFTFFLEIGLVFALCELIMTAGYFLFELFVYNPAAALGAVPFNLIQGAAGVIVGIVLIPVIRRLNLKNFKVNK